MPKEKQRPGGEYRPGQDYILETQNRTKQDWGKKKGQQNDFG